MEGDTWTTLFFDGSRPDILRKNELDSKSFQPFYARDENWILGRWVDTSRQLDAKTIQVFWLLIERRRKLVCKVFPDYSEENAKAQLSYIGVSPTPKNIEDAVSEFDRFYREARAYRHIDLFCSARERVYFPQFHGVITDIPIYRFSSGYWNKRAVVLEAIRPKLCSRRILSEDVNHLSEDCLKDLEKLSLEFYTTSEVISLSSFEQAWYYSLLNDRLRRLDALHRIGVTHADIHDFHFRLPNDFYDTVLYDFSASYTFSEKRPFRVNSGRPRSLRRISAGERSRVLLGIQNRAISRDLRSYLIKSNPEASVDNALWQSLDKEVEFLELIMLKVSCRPDGFSMPTLNSIFPFLEAVCPKSDLCWHIRRARLLRHYKPVWVVFRDDEAQTQSITFDCELQFGTIETMEDSRFILCLVPDSWTVSLKTELDLDGLCKLRKFCSHLISEKAPGAILEQATFFLNEADTGETGDKKS